MSSITFTLDPYVAKIIGLFVVAVPVVLIKKWRKKQLALWGQAAHQLGLQPQGTAFAMTGVYQGARVEVDRYKVKGRNNTTTYTRFRAMPQVHLPVGLLLRREGVWAGITKVFGAQDIEVGDAYFDGQFIIKATDAAGAYQLLSNPQLRHALASCSTQWERFQISENRVEVSCATKTMLPHQLAKGLAAVAGCAHALQQAAGIPAAG
ncbi:MAG: hypothetical protein JKY37_26030 [Nannocystaceae bacterium]|nr:hypothetical protein [Nannocystaceae bacterium]